MLWAWGQNTLGRLGLRDEKDSQTNDKPEGEGAPISSSSKSSGNEEEKDIWVGVDT